jgi:hypothetical protein
MSGRGSSSFATGKLEFDVSGVQKFTTEIGKAKKEVHGLVDEFERMSKVLGRMDDKKLAAIGAAGGGSSRPGQYGDTPTFGGSTDPRAITGAMQRPGGGATFGGAPATPGSGARPGGGTRVPGVTDSGDDPTATFMRWQYAGQVASGVGNRVGGYYANIKNDFATSDAVGQMAANRSGQFGYDNPFRGSVVRDMHNRYNMQGSTGALDQAGAYSTSMANYGVGRARDIAGQFANMNMINPGLGGADPAAQQFGSLLSTQMINRAAPFGGVAVAPGGARRNGTQTLEQAMRLAAGNKNYWELTPEQAQATFEAGSGGYANLEYLGFSPEMIRTAQETAAIGAAQGKRVPIGDNKAMRDMGITSEFADSTADRENKSIQDRAALFEEGRSAMILENKAREEVESGLRGLLATLGPFGAALGAITELLGGGINLGTSLVASGAMQAVRSRMGNRGGSRGGSKGVLSRPGAVPKAPRPSRFTRGAKGAGTADAVIGIGMGVLSGIQHQQENPDASIRESGAYATRGMSGMPEMPEGGWSETWIARNFGKTWDPFGENGDANGAIHFNGHDPREGVGDAGGPLPGSGQEQGLNPKLLSGLQRMFRDNPKLRINSGYRSMADQQRLWDNRHSNPYPVARPGTSNHGKGLAADVGPRDQLNWVRQNAAKYGLTVPMPVKDPVHVEVLGGAPAPPERPETESEKAEGTKTGNKGGPKAASLGFTLGQAGGLSGGGLSSLMSTGGSMIGRSTGVGSVFSSGAESVAEGVRSAVGAVADAFGGANAGTPGAGGSGGKLGREGLINVLRQAGWAPGTPLRMGYAIAMAESRGNPAAVSPPNVGGPAPGSRDHGLFQVNDKYHPIARTPRVYDAKANAQYAWSLTNGGTKFRDWSTYNDGAYKKYLDSSIGDANASVHQGGGGHGGGGGGGAMAMVGGARITISNVNLNVKVDQVNDSEARRLANMVMGAIQEKANMASVGSG